MSISAMQSPSIHSIAPSSNSSRVIGSSKSPFKTGYILINNKKIKLASTLARTAANINKKSIATGVTAKIVRDNKGNERLVLTSSKRTVSIKDPNKLLANLVKSNKIGKGSDKLIQIVGKGSIGNNVRVKYSQKAPDANAADTLKLTETSKKLAKRLFPEVANENNNEVVNADEVINEAEADADEPAELNDLQNLVEKQVAKARDAYEAYAERQVQERRALAKNVGIASNSVSSILSNKCLKNVPEDTLTAAIDQRLSSMHGFDSQHLINNRQKLVQGISKALVAANESKRGYLNKVIWGEDNTYRLTNSDINKVVDKVAHEVLNVNAFARMYNAI